jgi:hypothetical protein
MMRGCAGLVISAMLISSVGVVAQGPGFGRGPGFGGGLGHLVTGEPYTASCTSTSVEKLADGTTITHSRTSTEARDAQGRTYVQTTGKGGGTSGETFTRTEVMDPVAHTLTSWGSQSKVAMLINLPTSPEGPGGPWGGGPGGGGPGEGGRGPGGPGGKFHAQVTREVLPGKTIAGVYATGVKTTMTVPVGAEGNDKPLVSVREVWTSPDLKIVVLETSDSPREGFHKMEITSLTEGEPDSTLFQVPAGYTVKTQTRHRGE